MWLYSWKFTPGIHGPVVGKVHCKALPGHGKTRRASRSPRGSWAERTHILSKMNVAVRIFRIDIYKASQPRGRASGSRAYGRQEMQGVIFKSTRHECSVFVNLRPLLLRIRSRHQFSLPEKTGFHCGIRTHVHPFTRRNA